MNESMITPGDVQWLPPQVDSADLPGRVLYCPVCGSHGPHKGVLNVRSISPPHAPLVLLRCDACGSLYYDPPGITDFSDRGQTGEDFWRLYVEVGGGVWETIWPTLADRRTDRRTLLDVGCGFGFAVDFWRRLHGGDSVGVELADYGQVGARLLGVPIYDQLLQDCAKLVGRRFDVVYASEVIEHVPDPHAFIAVLADYVSDDGVLVLTTPSSEFIQPANHSATLLAALSPGFHGFILSRKAFDDAARSCGFAHVDVRSFEERQILWASRRPLRVEPHHPAMRALYMDYLAAHSAKVDSTSPVWQGLAYRYVKELVNVGRLSEAKAVAATLMTALKQEFADDIDDPQATLSRLRACNTLNDYGRVSPYFMPCFYYFLGALAQHHDRDATSALSYYVGAVDCTLESARFGSVLEALSLVWPARAQQAGTLLAKGDADGACALWLKMAEEGNNCDARNAFALAPRDLLEVTIPRVCESLWTQGHAQDAQRLFAAYCTYVRERYGSRLLATEGVAAALDRPDQNLPMDPMFAPYFTGRQRMPEKEAISELIGVGRVLAAHSAHPTYGTRFHELANATEKTLLRFGIDRVPRKQNVIWSFDVTYKHRPH